MTQTADVTFQPVVRKEYLDRLAALSPTPDVTPELWAKVHDEIQEQLGPLETEVRRRVSGIRVDVGYTKGQKFHLFSYRTFLVPNSSLDPVVVGLTFRPAPQGVSVEADISGEQTGDIISSLPSKTMAHSSQVLLAGARDSARKLCQSAEAVAAALTDPSRKID